MNRLKILNFLQWNDRNGVYTDEYSIEEGYEPLTFVETVKAFVNAMKDNPVDCFLEINVTQAFKVEPNIKKALYMILRSDDKVETYKNTIHLL